MNSRATEQTKSSNTAKPKPSISSDRGGQDSPKQATESAPNETKAHHLTLAAQKADSSTSQPTKLLAQSLLISQDFGADLEVEKLLTVVPVRKPRRTDWIRVHPEWVVTPVALITLKEENETYALAPSILSVAAGESGTHALFPAITREGTVFLWPVRISGADGQSNRWWESAYDGAERARKTWVRMVSNMNLGAYEIFTTKANIPDPTWPDTNLDEIVDIAFRGRLIDSADHPVLRRLRGEL